MSSIKCILIVRNGKDVMQRSVTVDGVPKTLDQVKNLLQKYDFRLESTAFEYLVSSPEVSQSKSRAFKSNSDVASFFALVRNEVTFDITLKGSKNATADFQSKFLDDDLVTILVFPPLADSINPDADVVEKMFIIPTTGVLGALTRAVLDTLKMDRTLGPHPSVSLFAITSKDRSKVSPLNDELAAKKLLQQNARAGTSLNITYTLAPPTPKPQSPKVAKAPGVSHPPSPTTHLTSEEKKKSAVTPPSHNHSPSPRPNPTATRTPTVTSVPLPASYTPRPNSMSGAVPPPASSSPTNTSVRRDSVPASPPPPLARQPQTQPQHQQQQPQPSVRPQPSGPRHVPPTNVSSASSTPTPTPTTEPLPAAAAPAAAAPRTHKCDIRVHSVSFPSDQDFVFTFNKIERDLFQRFRSECQARVSVDASVDIAVFSGGEQFPISNDGQLREWMALSKESCQPLRVHVVKSSLPPSTPIGASKSPRSAPFTAAPTSAVLSAAKPLPASTAASGKLPVLASDMAGKASPRSVLPDVATKQTTSPTLSEERLPAVKKVPTEHHAPQPPPIAREGQAPLSPPAAPKIISDHMMPGGLPEPSAGISPTNAMRDTSTPSQCQSSIIMSATEVQLPKGGRTLGSATASSRSGGPSSQMADGANDDVVVGESTTPMRGVTPEPRSPPTPNIVAGAQADKKQQQAVAPDAVKPSSAATPAAAPQPQQKVGLNCASPPPVSNTQRPEELASAAAAAAAARSRSSSEVKALVHSTHSGVWFQSFFRCGGFESLVQCQLSHDSMLKDLKQAVCNEFGMPIRVDNTVKISLHHLGDSAIDDLEINSDEVLRECLNALTLSTAIWDAKLTINQPHNALADRSEEVLLRELSQQLVRILGHQFFISDLQVAFHSCKKRIAGVPGAEKLYANLDALQVKQFDVESIQSLMDFLRGIFAGVPQDKIMSLTSAVLTHMRFFSNATPTQALRNFFCRVFGSFPRRAPLQKSMMVVSVAAVDEFLKRNSLTLPDSAQPGVGTKDSFSETEFCNICVDLFEKHNNMLLNCISAGVMEGRLCLRNHCTGMPDDELQALEAVLHSEIHHCFDTCSVAQLEEFIQSPDTAKDPAYDVVLSVVGALLAPQPVPNYTQWVVDHFRGKLSQVLYSKMCNFVASESLSLESLYAAIWELMKPELEPSFLGSRSPVAGQLCRWAFFSLQLECLLRRTQFPPVPPYNGLESALRPICGSPILIAGALGRVTSAESRELHQDNQSSALTNQNANSNGNPKMMKKGKVQYKYKYRCAEWTNSPRKETRNSASEGHENEGASGDTKVSA